MESKIYEKINIIRYSKAYKLATAILFPVLIIIYSFIKVNKGLDITDSAYSCTNFTFTDRLDGMWYYSTFYANLIGHLFTLLPGGRTLLGLNIYTGLVKLAMALVAYYFFTYEVKVERELSFAGVMVSVALCWCPTTILYNYLTYLLFLLGAIFMYIGLTREKKSWLIAAGFMLGSNVLVRLPNIAEAALIVALWIYCYAVEDTFKTCVNKTLLCVAGYLGAFIPGAVLIAVTRGFKEYFNGIMELFAMTDESTSYSARAMVMSVIRQYIENWKWTEIAVFMCIICLLAFLVLPATLTWLRYILATIATAFFGMLMFKKDLVSLNFHWFGPVYRFGALILSFAIVWFIVILLRRSAAAKEKLLAAIALVVIAITPLGSNNDIYTNLNFLFLILPVFLYFVVRFISTNEYFRGVRYSVMLMTCAWFFLCLVFGVTYIFRDGLDAPMDTLVTNNPVMAGMKTEAVNAKRLTELNDIWDKNGLKKGEVLLYGDVSGIGFYMDTPVAISTAWPSLASFSTDKFEKDMETLSANIELDKATPTIVLGVGEIKALKNGEINRKQEILKEFIEKYNYKEIYSNDVLSVLLAE